MSRRDQKFALGFCRSFHHHPPIHSCWFLFWEFSCGNVSYVVEKGGWLMTKWDETREKPPAQFVLCLLQSEIVGEWLAAEGSTRGMSCNLWQCPISLTLDCEDCFLLSVVSLFCPIYLPFLIFFDACWFLPLQLPSTQSPPPPHHLTHDLLSLVSSSWSFSADSSRVSV